MRCLLRWKGRKVHVLLDDNVLGATCHGSLEVLRVADERNLGGCGKRDWLSHGLPLQVYNGGDGQQSECQIP